MAEVLQTKIRDARGKRETRRLRRSGSVPAVLYGHGEANLSLMVPADEMASVVRHGGRVVELQGSVNEKALIRALQWDTYGKAVMHVDFTRVSEHERISLNVPVELRGEAPGVKQGGIVEHMLHEVEIECEALSIPEKLDLSINELRLGESLTAAKLNLPAGVTLLTDADAVIAQCVEPTDIEEGTPTDTGAEPEVIGRKAEEEEAE